MTKADTIAAVSTYFDDGGFERDLATLVAFETESQAPEQAPELHR